MMLTSTLVSVSFFKGTLVLVLLPAVLLVDISTGIRLTNMTAPRVADFRNNMSLDCHFNMGNEDLNSVKWYKDGSEFFRYQPNQQPHIMIFPVQGISMVTHATDCGEHRCKVMLTNLTRMHSSGNYTCEISTEAPAFRLASETRDISIVGMPNDNPRIDNVGDDYKVGHFLTARCTSPSASPTPALSWFINEQQAPAAYVSEGTTSLPDDQGLTTRSTLLRFQIDKKHAPNNLIILKCKSSLPGIPLHPQTVSQTVMVRSERYEQVNNQQRYWSHEYSSGNHRLASVNRVLVLIAIVGIGAHRWI